MSECMDANYDDFYYEERMQSQAATYCFIIEDLIDELKDQNFEIVALRRLLMKYMTEDGADYMKDEIYDALYPQYCRAGMELYISYDREGNGPFEDPDYLSKLFRCAKGKYVDGHPNICADSLRPFRR